MSGLNAATRTTFLLAMLSCAYPGVAQPFEFGGLNTVGTYSDTHPELRDCSHAPDGLGTFCSLTRNEFGGVSVRTSVVWLGSGKLNSIAMELDRSFKDRALAVLAAKYGAPKIRDREAGWSANWKFDDGRLILNDTHSNTFVWLFFMSSR